MGMAQAESKSPPGPIDLSWKKPVIPHGIRDLQFTEQIMHSNI